MRTMSLLRFYTWSILQANIFRGSALHRENVHVFSAFGFVHKIATFEKTAGFQALVQFSDPQTACAAKDALDGRNIPSYLLPENMGPFALKMTFSAHTDLNVKFQSHRSRDYTNPYLPVAPSAIDGGGQCFTSHDAKKQETECNVLLVSMENMQYTVNVDVLHTVFSSFGPVQKIAIFEKNAGFHALVQYPDVGTASAAKQALEGHCIYDGGFCRLHLTYSHHTDISVKVNNDRSRDYTIQNASILNNQPSILGQQPQPPMLGTTTSPQYNNAPTGQMPGVMTAPSPIGAWNMGVGPMTQLSPQMPHGPYIYPIPSHNLPDMNSGKLQWPVPGGHLPVPPFGR
ncbi:polypyrimidine tract-binding protein homolog 2-like isoform X3 [Aristolochia californica]|uniref:polypyrimidine tract-binding protein homolog 2-like isoform X3 n=1 Tax=Aristolochia californica TaxID=171875 RepID=UPI0035E0E6B0